MVQPQKTFFLILSRSTTSIGSHFLYYKPLVWFSLVPQKVTISFYCVLQKKRVKHKICLVSQIVVDQIHIFCDQPILGTLLETIFVKRGRQANDNGSHHDGDFVAVGIQFYSYLTHILPHISLEKTTGSCLKHFGRCFSFISCFGGSFFHYRPRRQGKKSFHRPFHPLPLVICVPTIHYFIR